VRLLYEIGEKEKKLAINMKQNWVWVAIVELVSSRDVDIHSVRFSHGDTQSTGTI